MVASDRQAALTRLLAFIATLTINSVTHDEALGQLVKDALAASTKPWLGELLTWFGWDGACFTRTVDVRELFIQLKLISFKTEPLQEIRTDVEYEGRVFKVRAPLFSAIGRPRETSCSAPRRCYP